MDPLKRVSQSAQDEVRCERRGARCWLYWMKDTTQGGQAGLSSSHHASCLRLTASLWPCRHTLSKCLTPSEVRWAEVGRGRRLGQVCGAPVNEAIKWEKKNRHGLHL